MTTKTKGLAKANWLTPQMRLYILHVVTKRKEIKCEDCGTYKGIHIHHDKYNDATIDDLVLLCKKCHAKRHGWKHKRLDETMLSTIFENNKRFCVGGDGLRFEY